MNLFLLIRLIFFFLQDPPVNLKTGDKFPSCVLTSSTSYPVFTDSLKGNVLVVDFWASWNIPSRKHNLQLVKMYEKYRQQNFRKKGQIVFLSVSIDTQADLWMVARVKDNLHWPNNICNFKGWEDEITDQLGVGVIPANFIIDPQGVLRGKDMWGAELDSTLSELSKEMPN